VSSRLLLIVACTLCLPVLASGPMVRPGTGPAAQVEAEDGDTYLALCEEALAFVQVRVAPLGEPWDMDEEPLVAVEAPCEAVMLFGPAAGLDEGPVRRARVQGDVSASMKVELGTSRQLLKQEPVGESGFRVVVQSEEGEEVELFRTEASEAGHAEVLWAGDLNGDGALDVLLKAAGRAHAEAYRLYLSPMPSQGQWAEVAASLPADSKG
jgi:hypothetical protein